MEFDSANYSIAPDTNQDIQTKDLSCNITIVKDSFQSISFTGGIRMNEKENELKDMCDKAFKRNSIYPLMEIPKPDSKGTIEEQYKQGEIFVMWNDINRVDASEIWKQLNDLYIKSENTKKEMQVERNVYNKMLSNSLSVVVPIKSYDMIIIKSVL